VAETVNLQVRVGEETRDLFNALAEQSGIENKGEFFKRLVGAYQVEIVKEQSPQLLKPAIETVETLTSRLQEVLIGAGAILTTREEQHTQQIDEQYKSFNETRDLLQQKITFLEQEKTEVEERIQVFISEANKAEQQAANLRGRIRELEQVSQDKQALIDEYRGKNDTLTSIVNEYKEAAEENKKLQAENADLTKKVQSNDIQVSVLKERVDRQTEQYTADIERLKEALDIEREKAVLNIERKHQKELQDMQEKQSRKIDEYEAKILNLIDEKTNNPQTPQKAAPARRSRAVTPVVMEPEKPTNEALSAKQN